MRRDSFHVSPTCTCSAGRLIHSALTYPPTAVPTTCTHPSLMMVENAAATGLVLSGRAVCTHGQRCILASPWLRSVDWSLRSRLRRIGGCFFLKGAFHAERLRFCARPQQRKKSAGTEVALFARVETSEEHAMTNGRLILVMVAMPVLTAVIIGGGAAWLIGDLRMIGLVGLVAACVGGVLIGYASSRVSH